MNAYLTNKANNSRLTWIPVGFCALMALVGFGSFFEDLLNRPGITDNLMELCYCILFLLPLFFKIRKTLRIRTARKLAFGFSQSLEAEASYEKIEKLTGFPDAEARTLKLLELGFLQNVIVDMKERKFFLLAPNPENQQERILGVVCPSCGGANQAVVGKLNNCTFCGAPLKVTDSAHSTGMTGRFRKR